MISRHTAIELELVSSFRTSTLTHSLMPGNALNPNDELPVRNIDYYP